MKQRHIVLFAICVAAVALVILFISALHKHNEKAEKIEHIPDASLITIDGEEFSLTEMRRGQKTALLFFSPDCEFCQKEIEGIIENKDTFPNVKWVFVTLPAREELDDFLSEYPLGSIPDAKVCIADEPQLYIALNVTAPPTLFIYGSDEHLEHYSRGAVSIKTILEWLN